MRTVADLQRQAARVGATLVSAYVDDQGRLVGEFDVPDIDEGQPMATAMLLENLAAEDDDVEAIPSELVSWASQAGPAALHQYVQQNVKFTREETETFMSPAVALSGGVGDCDDSERALVAVARAAGIPARLVYYLQDGQPAHVTAQLWSGGAWRWAETTIAARFGEEPMAAMRRLRLRRSDIGGTPYLLGTNGKAVPLTSKPPSGMGDVDPNWPSYLGDTFATTLVQYSQSIGADPLGILKLLINESGGRLNPNAQNPNGFTTGYAVGINQFAPVSWGFFAPLTAVQYGQLTAEQQLPYVFGYFKHWMNAYGLSTISPRDLYWLNFLPATYVPNATDLHVIVTSSSGNYQNNKSLDHGHKNFITAGDLQLTIDGMSSNSMYKLIAPYVLEEVGGPTLPVAALMIGAGLWAGYKLAQSGALDAFIPNLSNLFPV